MEYPRAMKTRHNEMECHPEGEIREMDVPPLT